MHDCPKCRVPLHGHETVCPACDTPQPVSIRKSSKLLSPLPKAPRFNWLPIIAVLAILVIAFFISVQNSWMGQLITRPPEQEDPMAKLTYLDARNLIESKIQEGLAAVSAKGTFTWQKPDGSPADKNSPDPVMLSIQTRLADKEQRKGIIDPIKDYMEKANIPTLTMMDSRSHATWTYNVQGHVPTSIEQEMPTTLPSSGQ